jgi:hypothetical protein
MSTHKTEPPQVAKDPLVRLAAIKIREAIKKGPDEAGLSTTERYIVAFATCDRQLPIETVFSCYLDRRAGQPNLAAKFRHQYATAAGARPFLWPS